jgi:hypothetical protein
MSKRGARKTGAAKGSRRKSKKSTASGAMSLLARLSPF